MKVFKRNAVIITVLLFVCVAVYLNWSYNRGQELSADSTVAQTSDNASDDSKTSGEEEESSTLYYDESASSESSTYFDTARLSRQEARDSATATLKEATTVDGVSQEEIDSAVASITAMANYSVTEAKIENNLLAKDFSDCVVFISDGAVNIYVPAPEEGLNDTSVAQITETVLSEIEVTADQIKITEIK